METLDREVQRKVITILTAACGDIRYGEGQSPLLDVLFPDEGESIDLFDNWRLTATVRLPRNEAELRAIVMEVATAVVAQTRVRAIMASMYASLLFALLAREAERACPDFNVDAFLQRAALELEEGQSGT